MDAVVSVETRIFVGQFAEARELLGTLDLPPEYRAVKTVEVALKEGQLAAGVEAALAHLRRLHAIDEGAEAAAEAPLTDVARRLIELVCVMDRALGRASSFAGRPKSPACAQLVRHFWPEGAQDDLPPRKAERDWDKWAQEEEKREAREKDFEGDPAMHFFRQIYQNCDEDGKRAMMKSYTESNGRSLSTNWAAEKHKDYAGKDHIPPPEGVEEQPSR